MNYQPNGDHEIVIKIYKFNINESSVFCDLTSDMINDIQDFFDDISTGNILWETAKEKAIVTFGKKEYPEMSEDKILYFWNKNPNMFKRGHLKSVFDQLESSGDIKNIIRDIKINKITK